MLGRLFWTVLFVSPLALSSCGGQSPEAPAAANSIATEALDTHVPTQVPPTATPVPTQVPPTATPVPAQVTSTSKPAPDQTESESSETNTIISDFNFQLAIDGEVEVESSGWSQDQANSDEGILFFEYGEVSVLLFWFEDQDLDLDEVLADGYTLLEQTETELTYSLMSEGDSTVDTQPSKYLTYVANDDSEDNFGGGIIGSWKCPSGSVFSLAVKGSDATTIQIRFKRLLDSFACGQ